MRPTLSGDVEQVGAVAIDAHLVTEAPEYVCGLVCDPGTGRLAVEVASDVYLASEDSATDDEALAHIVLGDAKTGRLQLAAHYRRGRHLAALQRQEFGGLPRGDA